MRKSLRPLLYRTSVSPSSRHMISSSIRSWSSKLQSDPEQLPKCKWQALQAEPSHETAPEVLFRQIGEHFLGEKLSRHPPPTTLLHGVSDPELFMLSRSTVQFEDEFMAKAKAVSISLQKDGKNNELNHSNNLVNTSQVRGYSLSKLRLTAHAAAHAR